MRRQLQDIIKGARSRCLASGDNYHKWEICNVVLHIHNFIHPLRQFSSGKIKNRFHISLKNKFSPSYFQVAIVLNYDCNMAKASSQARVQSKSSERIPIGMKNISLKYVKNPEETHSCINQQESLIIHSRKKVPVERGNILMTNTSH